MKNLSVEHQAMVLLILNGAMDMLNKVIMAVQPVLTPLITAGQIVITMGTAVWIWRRARGAKLDNRIKELEIEKQEKK
jgi:hypothetical protein